MRHGVTPIAAMGNESTDLGNPTTDTASPDFPPGVAKTRTVDNSCITVQTEARGVIAVSSTGISKRKAYYSNYGTEQTEVAAPGGDAYDTPDETLDPRAEILAAYPKSLAVLKTSWNRTAPRRQAPGSSGTARARTSAGTTSTCREPRWRLPTPSAWPPCSSAATATATGTTAGRRTRPAPPRCSPAAAPPRRAPSRDCSTTSGS